MRSTKEKLIEFVVGVTGGTFLVAGILSLGTGSSVSRLWIVVGAIGVIVAWFLHRKSPGK